MDGTTWTVFATGAPVASTTVTDPQLLPLVGKVVLYLTYVNDLSDPPHGEYVFQLDTVTPQ